MKTVTPSPFKKLTLITTLFFGLCSAQAFADSQVINTLINELGRSFDPNVQTELVRTLKSYNQSSDVRYALLNQLNNGMNFQNVRIEAARSLSNLISFQEVSQALINAHDSSQDAYFRSEMIKTLYLYAPQSQRVRQVLISNLQGNHDERIKIASAFALKKSLDDGNTRQQLLNLVRNRFLSTNVRTELLKSLYNGISYSEVRNAIQNIALDGSEDINLRGAATRIISVAPQSRSQRSALFNLLANSQHASLRAQAASGLKLQMTEEDVRWLGLATDPRTGLGRNPF